MNQIWCASYHIIWYDLYNMTSQDMSAKSHRTRKNMWRHHILPHPEQLPGHLYTYVCVYTFIQCIRMCVYISLYAYIYVHVCTSERNESYMYIHTTYTYIINTLVYTQYIHTTILYILKRHVWQWRHHDGQAVIKTAERTARRLKISQQNEKALQSNQFNWWLCNKKSHHFFLKKKPSIEGTHYGWRFWVLLLTT